MKSPFKIFIIALFWIFFQGTVFGQEPASLNCLSVNANGDVTIFWTPPGSSASFEKYVLYISENSSPYAPVVELTDINIDQYTHVGIGADQNSKSYFIETKYVSDGANSDTLETIYLQLDNLPNFNEAKLYWNELKKPLPGSASATYNIYKEHPLGSWNLVASLVDQIQYSEPVIVCNDSINYIIEVENSTGCKSVSNVKGAWFKNLEEPEKPVIDSVSINENENSVIGWEPVGNAAAYIIYRFDDGIWTSIDTVYGMNNTFYEDVNSSPCSKSLTYTVATIDTCGTSGPKDENEKRKTLRIINANYNACTETVSIAWNPYQGPDAEKYEIWISENESDFVKTGETSMNDTAYEYSINNVGTTYSFFIRARFSTGTSTTCSKSVATFEYSKPDYIYLANANVLPTNEIELKIDVDTNVNSCSWEIYHVNIEAVIVSKIDSIQKSEVDSFPLMYVDTTAAPELSPFNYYVYVYDSCGNEVLESNILKTIYLTGSSFNTFENLLEWNAFEGWDAGVEKYYIFRMFNGEEPTSPIDSVDAQTLQYFDDMSLVSNLSSPPVYWVQAIEMEGNVNGFKEKSNSNRIGVAKDSEMYVANAFRPQGYTTEFKPVFRFYSGKNYLFQIFNRWGQLIFETSNPNDGWDGTYQAKNVEPGVYVYRLVYEKLDESSTEKKGTVTVIY